MITKEQLEIRKIEKLATTLWSQWNNSPPRIKKKFDNNIEVFIKKNTNEVSRIMCIIEEQKLHNFGFFSGKRCAFA